MFKKILCWILVISLATPTQLLAVFAVDVDATLETVRGHGDDLDQLVDEFGSPGDRMPAWDGLSQDGPEPEPPEEPEEPEQPDPEEPSEPDNPEPDNPNPDPVPIPDPKPQPGTSTNLRNVYKCLLNELQNSVATGYRYANVSGNYNGQAIGENLDTAVLGFDVQITYETRAVDHTAEFNPMGTCRSFFRSLTRSQVDQLKMRLQSLTGDAVLSNGIMQEYMEVEQAIFNSAADERYTLNNTRRAISYRPTQPYDTQEQFDGVRHMLSKFLELSGSNSPIVDRNFNELRGHIRGDYQLVKASNYIVALRIKAFYLGQDETDMEEIAVGQQEDLLIDSAEEARRRAEEEQESADRREMWGNIAKVGLAVGGGILAWKLIDGLNSDDDDEDEDRFDGPMYPPYMQPPYQPYPPQQMYPPGGGMYPPGTGYPPGQQPYPPQPQPQPQPQPYPQPQPPQPGGQDYASMLYELEQRLNNIIRLQRELITNYVQRTNTNMTDSDRDNFRRTLAEIDGEIRIANPQIAQMDNSPVPPNAANMGAINEKRAAVYRLVTEIQNNDRIIKEFNASMNVAGTGAAGPAATGSSPNLASTGNSGQPWVDPQVRSYIDEYLRNNNLNRWGMPNTEGARQFTPPAAVGMDSYQWNWRNPTIQNYVNSRMSGN